MNCKFAIITAFAVAAVGVPSGNLDAQRASFARASVQSVFNPFTLQQVPRRGAAPVVAVRPDRVSAAFFTPRPPRSPSRPPRLFSTPPPLF